MAVMGTAYGQADTDIVNIPDERFKKILLDNFKINLNGDWEITYEEARAYTGRIDASNMGIKSLTGIEAFINIIGLDCYSNPLKRLDVSKNTALQYLNCRNNELTSLDVSKNIVLKELKCSSNRLTHLDLSKNIELRDLMCGSNQLTSLDLSNNIALEYLGCEYNKLTSLDLSNNVNLSNLKCYENQLTYINLANGNNSRLRVDATRNPKLKCIQIDRGFTPPSLWWHKGYDASYRTICN